MDTNTKINAIDPDLEELILIPKVTSRKNIDNSKGLLTGCLNLTIDNAPTIPNDNAMLPEIAFVIINDIKGKRKHVNIKL